MTIRGSNTILASNMTEICLQQHLLQVSAYKSTCNTWYRSMLAFQHCNGIAAEGKRNQTRDVPG